MSAAVDSLPWVGVRHRVEASDRDGALRIVRLADEQVVGEIELERTDGAIFVRRLQVQLEHRGYGAGSEAAWLLLDAAEAAGSGEVRAWAAPSLGLSVYFWTRMGMRPSFGEGPGGGIWFERTFNRS